MLLKFGSLTRPAMVWLAMNAPEESAAMVVRSKSSALPCDVMRKPPLSMMSAAVASAAVMSSLSASLSRWMSSSMSCGRVDISGMLGNALIDVFLQQHTGDHVQRFEHTLAFVGTGGKRRHLYIAVVHKEIHVFERSGVRQVALVILQHVWNLAEVELQRLQIVRQVLERLDILSHFFVLRISHEHDAIHPAQDQLARGVVNHLAGHRVELELGLEAFDGHRLDRQKVKEQCPIRTRRERNKFALVACIGLDVVVDLDEVGRLAAHCRAVIDDLDLQFLGRLVDDGHI